MTDDAAFATARLWLKDCTQHGEVLLDLLAAKIRERDQAVYAKLCGDCREGKPATECRDGAWEHQPGLLCCASFLRRHLKGQP